MKIIDTLWATMIAILVVAFCFPQDCEADASDNRPNIVLIISDDQDNEHLGFIGNETVCTPNLLKGAGYTTFFGLCFTRYTVI